ncbi:MULTISPECIES: IclR family transcriptional regulator [Vitreoscilla]|uniref:IclR family transcriptional regulator n=1 Tax=Vitreoscilla stercoraria TaxID=61 RepID=A0ABY4ED62_VITST|nr:MULTISPECIES: IclR family transcriptional regulator [Vitreoscilla]AUZ05374.2 IclR family transcriptional regulator [Vitreoscilla sp. C1]UOO93314.1 IclR family transcriptional regulator [Vitreoscilla stercoraria]
MQQEKKKGSSVERVLQLVETVAKSERPISPSDLADILDIPKPSIHRLVQQLQQTGFLQLDLQGKVICGQRTHQLAFNLWQTSHYKMERQAVLQQLASVIGETVGVAVLHELEVVYIDRVLSNWPLQIYLPEGTHVPIWASASGKLLLAQRPENQFRRIVEQLPLHALTKNTQTDPAQLFQTLQQAKALQLGLDNEEFIPGMVACAVPIPNGDKEPFAAVFTHGPTLRKSLEQLQSFIPHMRQAATELAAIFDQQASCKH